MSSLFQSADWASPSPRMAGEAQHKFFDRVTGPYWDEVRRVADEFLNRVPVAAHKDIIGRWRSGDDAAATSAWWEVYLHEWLIRSGFDVDVHEVQENGRAPDFRAQRRGETLFLEATGPGVSGEQRAKGNRQGDLFKQLNQVKSETYVLWIDHLDVGMTPIRFRDWRNQIDQWLDTLPEGGSGRATNLLTLNDGDWMLEVRAVPRKNPLDPRLGPRAIGVYPMEAGVRDDVEAARRLLQSKRSAYGKLDAPLVIAVWTSRITHRQEDWRAALFGGHVTDYSLDGSLTSVRREYDGLWGGPDAWKDTHVGGVLIGLDPSFHTIARSIPQWWAHPEGGLQSLDLSPLADVYADGPEVEHVELAPVTPSQFFDLSDPWPPFGNPWQHPHS